MRAVVIAVLVLVCLAAVIARPVHKIHKRSKARVAALPYDAIPQLMLPSDGPSLALVIDDGEITKATDVEMVWQADEASTSAIKEIHTLAGGEEGVTSGRTWVFLAADWSGFQEWAAEHADHVASYASINLDTMVVEWKVLLRPGDDPTDADCASFASAIAAGDLSGAMLIVSHYFEQDLALDGTSDAYLALSTLINNADLYAERLDTSCLGYKLFSAYDSPTTTADVVAASSDTPSDAPDAPPDEAPAPPSDAIFSDI